MSQEVLISSATLNRTFILSLCSELRKCMIIGFFPTQRPQLAATTYISDLISTTKHTQIFMQFAIAVPYQQLSSNRPLCENRLSNCHTFIVRRFILLSFKQQINKTNRYISPTQPMTAETQNFRTANNIHCRFRT